MEIENSSLFKEKLKEGINLFTGAGFSTLPDIHGEVLPTGRDLCMEIEKTFNILAEEFEYDLEVISSILPDNSYQDYLRRRFRVHSYNEKYEVLNKINMNSYITTNIDNIISQVISKSSRYYLRNLSFYGANKGNKSELVYLPLHGDVLNNNVPLYFKKLDLAVVDDVNRKLFETMRTYLRKQSTLFIGYGFHDKGILPIIKEITSERPQDLWIQCLPNDEKMKNLFSRLGCNLILGTTEELLDWININIKDEEIIEEHSDILEINGYKIPNIDDLEVMSSEDYFNKGETHWHAIHANHPYETKWVTSIYDAAIKNKKIIIVGGDFSGKSTLLMQLAIKVNASNKFYLKSPTKEEAKLILNRIGEKKSWVFLENCAEDIEAFSILLNSENIIVVGTAKEYQFEQSKHLIQKNNFTKKIVDEISENEAFRIYNHISNSIRSSNFRYKENEEEKFTMLEMIAKNIKHPLTKSFVEKNISEIMTKDKEAFELLGLSTYLTTNGSSVSTDILFSYFDIKEYKEVEELFNRTNSYLRELGSEYEAELNDQDYFILRSKLFTKIAKEVFESDPIIKREYREIIKKFIYKIDPFKIYRYYVFKRSAYDSSLFYSLFLDKAEDIYNYLYQFDKNPYTLQQLALYLSKLGKYEEAFTKIDKALQVQPNNFSMKNSKAIILFEANKGKNTPLAREQLVLALKNLEQCYSSDKRKVYHAQKYSEFVLYLEEDYGNSTEINIAHFLTQASDWIDEIIKDGSSNSRRTLQLKEKLKKVLSYNNY